MKEALTYLLNVRLQSLFRENEPEGDYSQIAREIEKVGRMIRELQK